MLPDDLKKDVILRIARMEELDSRAMEELDRVLESQLGKLQRIPPRKVMGPDNLASILNATDSELEKEMLEALTEADEELSDDVKEKMFVFDNLMKLDDKGFQRLREVAQEKLLIASRVSTMYSLGASSTTCPSGRLKFCEKTWKPRVRLNCPTSKPRRKK